MRVRIEVEGGIAQVVEKPLGVEVVVVDLDPDSADEPMIETIYDAETEIEDGEEVG